MARSRIQRWTLKLVGYNYDVQYRAGPQNGKADAMSMQVTVPEEGTAWEIVLSLRRLHGRIAGDRTTDWVAHRKGCMFRYRPKVDLIRMVDRGVQSRWKEMKALWQRRNGLTSHDGCLMWRHRVVIPPKAREKLLRVLHEDHPRICKAKHGQRVCGGPTSLLI